MAFIAHAMQAEQSNTEKKEMTGALDDSEEGGTLHKRERERKGA